MGFCNCSMFCCALICVHYSFATISMWKREQIALLSLSSWCLVIVVWLFLSKPRVCLQFVNVAFPDHTHLLFLLCSCGTNCLGAICMLCYVVSFGTNYIGAICRLCYVIVVLTKLVLFVGFIM